MFIAGFVVYRLGGGEEDVRAIMEHAFFENLNWNDLYEKKVLYRFDCMSSIYKFNNVTTYFNNMNDNILNAKLFCTKLLVDRQYAQTCSRYRL